MWESKDDGTLTGFGMTSEGGGASKKEESSLADLCSGRLTWFILGSTHCPSSASWAEKMMIRCFIF